MLLPHFVRPVSDGRCHAEFRQHLHSNMRFPASAAIKTRPTRSFKIRSWRCLNSCLNFALALLALWLESASAEPFRYTEGKYGGGELRYINDVPVLVVAGTPEEIGEQMGTLAKAAIQDARQLIDGYAEAKGLAKFLPVLLKTASTLRGTFPPDHLKELEAVSKASGLSLDLLIAAHVMHDMLKLRGCSDIVVEPAKSATGELLFGRNTDTPHVDKLHEYSLVVVFRPKGKHAFAAVSFPGAVGLGAAMNDAGLCLGQNEILSAGDGSTRYNPLGTPSFLASRRILEECKYVDEAEKLIREVNWPTSNLFMIADRKEGRVFEITPKNVRVLKSTEALCAATNYFRTAKLATPANCWRIEKLNALRSGTRMGVGDVAKVLDDVHQAGKTIHSMVFEPVPLRGHFALGEAPSTKLPFKQIDLAGLLRPAK
jgi:isopenicillin-N N-acyltransferase-like protein